MKEYRISAADFSQSLDDDCVLAADDPVYQMVTGTQYREPLPQIAGSSKGQTAREQNIQPGTDAWFKHWFGDKR
jgi:hypothetical protein